MQPLESEAGQLGAFFGGGLALGSLVASAPFPPVRDSVAAWAAADGCGAEPTVIITLDGLQFTRLAGGRPLVAGRSQEIGYGGDSEAGKRIVENLAYVI